jgi:nitrate/TMAO reductase-like tetraheme cytochrome c subunit
MKLKTFYSVLVLVSASVLFITAFTGKNSGDPVLTNKDLINFSHSIHSELVSCADCHSTVASSTSLKDRLLPNHESCESCHDVSNDQECSTCHKNDNYQPLIQTASTLLFNHSIHITDSKTCTDCHKGLDEVDYSIESASLNPAMSDCSVCHGETKLASNSCESCHIQTADLLPVTHRNVDFMRGHKYLSWTVDANCMMCHDNSTCDECHNSTTAITETNTSDNFYQPYMPGNSIDGPNQQMIVKVHGDLNYRYSHGIDAKGQTSECQTCHSVENFCVNCHAAENTDFAMGGIVPSSHLSPDFAFYGVGSGGGEHSILAKRDIERCTSCHDVQGADPTCIQCHLDSDGIQGTNPKTHASGFMKGERGDWHDSQGSICYNCHTSSGPGSQPTSGFCNYCHVN